MIYEGVEEYEESAETARLGRDYITLGVSPEVRSRASSPKIFVNNDSASTTTSVQEETTLFKHSSDNPNANSMAGHDIRLPTFNGNGAEDPEQRWFICEAVWMVPLV